jgi:hypothetical protein
MMVHALVVIAGLSLAMYHYFVVAVVVDVVDDAVAQVNFNCL